MKKSLALFALCSLSISSYAQMYTKVIYGTDNRMEVSEAPIFYSELAKSTAGQIAKSQMKKGFFKYSFVNPMTYQQRYNLCDGERFLDQLATTPCTAFLVGPDVLVTAGHCVPTPSSCQNSYWIFDFNVEKDGSVKSTFSSSQVVSCKEIIAQKKDPQTQNDYAVIRLNKKVKGRPFLKFRSEGTVDERSELLVIGHPSALPTKITDKGTLRSNENPVFFQANLDTFAGNSGSPVLDAQTGLVEGILVRGERDFVYDEKTSCYRVNTCNEGECRGEDVTRITNITDILNKALK